MLKELKKKYKEKIILSYHNFKETPNNIEKIIRSMIEIDAKCVKIVTMLNSYKDILVIKNILARYKNKIAMFGMGEFADITRIMALTWGSKYIYASINNDEKAAPGQISADELRDIYRIDRMNSETKILGLIGNPVKHSKGIYIHNKYFEKNNVDAVYINFLCENLESEWKFLSKLIDGASITMPFKETIQKLINKDKIDLPSINTIKRLENDFITCNTDIKAINRLLKIKMKDKLNHNNKIIIIGSGGVAKSLIYNFHNLGFINVDIWCRNHDKINNDRYLKELINSEKNYQLIKELNSNEIYNKEYDIMINASSVGFNDEKTSILNKEHLHSKPLIVDFIHTPVYTKLIKDSISYNCLTINGKEIYDEQAKLQQEFWVN